MENNFKVILEAMIDNSSLSDIQKQLAKERLKIGADISVEDFAKSKQEIEKQIASLAANIKSILGNAVSDKQANQWAKDYYDSMISGAKQATKEQESLINAMAKGREQAEKSRRAEEKRQQTAQSKAINKALEAEYKERQKNIQAAEKQAELDRENALAFTKSASKKLSSAISKYSYGDSSDATAMMKRMNRGVMNFGDLSDVDKDIKQLSSTVDKIISDLKLSHEQSLQALNSEIKAEQESQSQKDSFNQRNLNAIDYEIKKREQEARTFSSVLRAQMQEKADLATQANDIRRSMEGKNGVGYGVQIDEEIKKFRDLGFTEKEAAQRVKILTDAHDELKNVINSTDFDSVEAKNRAIIDADEKRNVALNQVRNAYKGLKADASQYYNLDKQTKLSNNILNWLSKNTRASKDARQALQEYYRELSGGRVSVERLEYIEKELEDLDAQQRVLGRLGKSLKDQFKQAAESFGQWISVSSAIMFGVQKTREAVTELKELDNILTEISKTSDLTERQLAKLGDTAFDKGSKYGKSASDYLVGVQEMYRAGYENSEEMAELSTLAQAAGDMDADLANDYLIATDAAYKLEGNTKKLNEVLDGQNNITNKNALSMRDLAEATKIAASQSYSSGIAIDKSTAAMGVMMASTRQGGDVAARAWKGILMNIQQVKGEVADGEIIDEASLSKYEKASEALGVSLKEVKNGVVSLRDPMVVLEELSKAYTALDKSDVRRANLISAVGGKYRGNQLNALLENWDLYEKMLKDYASGDGSALREAEKSANNLE